MLTLYAIFEKHPDIGEELHSEDKVIKAFQRRSLLLKNVGSLSFTIKRPIGPAKSSKPTAARRDATVERYDPKPVHIQGVGYQQAQRKTVETRKMVRYTASQFIEIKRSEHALDCSIFNSRNRSATRLQENITTTIARLRRILTSSCAIFPVGRNAACASGQELERDRLRYESLILASV